MIFKILAKYSIKTAFLQAWVATLGSLYFSEIRHWNPCLLCWYQRILMFPLVIILAVAIARRDRNVAYYVLPMSILGAAVAFYQYLLQMTSLATVTPIKCDALGSCTETPALVFGVLTLPHFVTIPFLSMTAFLIISAVMIIMVKYTPKNDRRT